MTIPVKKKEYKTCRNKGARGFECGKRIESFVNGKGQTVEICPIHGLEITAPVKESEKHGRS